MNQPTHINTHIMKKLIALVTCFVAALSVASAAEFPDISVKELKQAIADKKVIILDVNGSDSFAKGHIPSAIDFTATKGELDKVLAAKGKDTLVVAYCGGPKCSAYQAGASKAKELGFTNIKHLSAGISGWVEAGEKTEKVQEAAEVKKG